MSKLPGPLFTRDEEWLGGEIELLIYLGAHDEARVQIALNALWQSPSVEGCWTSNKQEPAEESKLCLEDVPDDSLWRTYGIAHLPNGCLCSCSTFTVTDEDGDWVHFHIPMGSLGYCYPVGAFPFDEQREHAWLVPVSEWFVDIARNIFTAVAFPSGLIGWLVPADTDEAIAILTRDIPSERWIGYLRNEGSLLHWYPPNLYKAPFSFENGTSNT